MKELAKPLKEELFRLIKTLKPFIPFIVLTIAMVFTSGKFSTLINVWHPQHASFAKFDNIYRYIKSSTDAFTWYKAFFYTDYVWALVGFVTLYLFLKKLVKIPFDRKALKAYVILAIMAYSADAIENYMYLSGKSELILFIKTWVLIKTALYGAAIFCILYFIYRYYIQPKLTNLWYFVSSSLISLLILGIIAGLLSQMGQGAVIVIELLKSKMAMLLSLFLITFLAQILSHFPTYFMELVLPQLRQIRDWKMTRFNIIGFGTIYYEPPEDININDPKWDSLNQKNREIRIWHHNLGIITFCSFIYIFLSVADSQSLMSVSGLTISFLLYLINSYFYRWFYYVMKRIKIKDADRKKKKWQILRLILLFVALSVLCALFSDWSKLGIIAAVISINLLMIAYAIFRACRFLLNIGSIPYITTMRIIGTGILIFLIVLNIWPYTSASINSLNILIAYLIVYYSAISLLLKHILYYADNHHTDIKKYKSYKFILPLLTVLGIVFLSMGHSIDNELHTLNPIEHKDQNAISISDYLYRIPYQDQDGKYPRQFYTGSYGGGIRANSWTLLVMNHLQKSSNGKFLKRNIGLSGVSGGMIGLGNYTALFKTRKDSFNTQVDVEDIERIAKYNFLSIDLTMALGRDFILEYFPGIEGKDRAYFSMKKYAEFSDQTYSFDKKSYQHYWHELYTKTLQKNYHYPALFVNTTSTTGHQGVASSVSIDKLTSKKLEIANVVPGSVDILKDSVSQISYFMTVSTANRFPILSPAAHIKNKGHFVDGGYFENSGMLTLWHFYDVLSKLDQDSTKTKHLVLPTFVNIQNSPEEYYKWWIDQIREKYPEATEISDGNISGEWAAIGNTILSLDKIPNYVRNKLYREAELIEIPLPYPLDYQALTRYMGGEPENPSKLMKLIAIHNENLINKLGNTNGIVVPSLARLQSDEVVKYQKSMLDFNPLQGLGLKNDSTYWQRIESRL